MIGLDSSALYYDVRQQLLRQKRNYRGIAPAPVEYNYTVYFAAGTVTATTTPAASVALTLSPNPASRSLLLLATDLPGQDVPIELTVLNALGQVVAQRQARARAGTLTQTWDVQSWPAGVYVLRLHSPAGPRTQRFLKQ